MKLNDYPRQPVGLWRTGRRKTKRSQACALQSQAEAPDINRQYNRFSAPSNSKPTIHLAAPEPLGEGWLSNNPFIRHQFGVYKP